MIRMKGDHRLRHAIVRVVVGLIAVFMVGVLGYLGWQTYVTLHKLSQPQERNTPYSAKYKARTYNGLTFATDLLKEAPEGVNADDWKVDEPGKGDVSSAVLARKCSQVAPSTAQISRKTASGDGLKATILIFGAGQARTQFDKYAKQIGECQPDVDTKNTTIRYDGGFITTRGDAIVSVLSDDGGKVDKASGWYMKRIDEGLKTTSCAAVDETAADANRSFYYDPNSYVGTIKQETVTVKDPILDSSAPQALVDTGMDVGKTFPDPKTQNISVPEAPVPQNVPGSLPNAPEPPTFQSRPKTPPSSKVVSYQVADRTGPGCGWDWSGQKVPKFNDSVLQDNRNITIRNARTELRNSISDYNRQAVDWSTQSAMEMSFQSQWDAYVNSTNAVYASWKTVNDARAAVRPSWMSYVDAMNVWSGWDQDQADAQKAWEDAVKQCVASATASNNANNQNPTPSGPDGLLTPEDIAKQNSKSSDEIQSECESATRKPDILGQQKPNKPNPPSLPDGIQIPNSWPKPKSS